MLSCCCAVRSFSWDKLLAASASSLQLLHFLVTLFQRSLKIFQTLFCSARLRLKALSLRFGTRQSASRFGQLCLQLLQSPVTLRSRWLLLILQNVVQQPAEGEAWSPTAARSGTKTVRVSAPGQSWGAMKTWKCDSKAHVNPCPSSKPLNLRHQVRAEDS